MSYNRSDNLNQGQSSLNKDQNLGRSRVSNKDKKFRKDQASEVPNANKMSESSNANAINPSDKSGIRGSSDSSNTGSSNIGSRDSDKLNQKYQSSGTNQRDV